MRNSLFSLLSRIPSLRAQIHTQTHRDDDDENDDENDERERFLRFSLMMSKNSSSNDNNTHQQKRIQTDDSIFATRESLRLVRQQSEGRETHEETTKMFWIFGADAVEVAEANREKREAERKRRRRQKARTL